MKKKKYWRDVSWSVQFEITIDGESAKFEDLPGYAQHAILDAIQDDHYSGFITYSED